MTAEIAVLNRMGVALAADSAVTVGRSAGKIWTSADKLFQLSESDPVAIMVYGNAEHVGIPWETLIKCYRQAHGNESFPTLAQHADRFFSFLAASPRLFPEERQDKYALRLTAAFWRRFRDDLEQSLSKHAEEKDGLEEGDIGPIFDQRCLSLLSKLRAAKPLDGFAVADRKTVRLRYLERFNTLYDELFAKLPVRQRSRRALLHAAVLMLTKHRFGPAKSGVVIAGFGSTDYWPSLLAYEVEGMLLGRTRSALTRSAQIDDDNNATVVPFAQQEMVHAFMNGIDPELSQALKSQTRNMFETSFSELLHIVSSTSPALANDVEALRPALAELLEAFEQDLKARQREYWEPVVANIATLPKDELAAMAEAFVNLTKFRRRVTIERETVGGPIDVAVVTKGDGFIWVKRKHYFDAGLNPRFVSRLRKE